jgi:hypothetical protein
VAGSKAVKAALEGQQLRIEFKGESHEQGERETER